MFDKDFRSIRDCNFTRVDQCIDPHLLYGDFPQLFWVYDYVNTFCLRARQVSAVYVLCIGLNTVYSPLGFRFKALLLTTEDNTNL